LAVRDHLHRDHSTDLGHASEQGRGSWRGGGWRALMIRS
jgi:hypothetical protein